MPVLAIASMLGMLNIASLGPFIPEIGRDLAVSAPLLGQITAAVFLGSAGIALLAGPLSDQYGRRRLLLIGLAVIALSSFGTMLAPNYGWLLATRLISAVSGGLMAGTVMAIAGTLFHGPQRRQAIGTVASGIALGPIAGIPAMTLIASLSSWRVSYGLLSVCALVFMVLAWRFLPNDNVRDAGSLNIPLLLSSYVPLLRTRSMVTLYSSTLMRAIGWMGVITYVGAFLDQQYGLSTREIGWTAMAAGSGNFIGTKTAGSSLFTMDLRRLYGMATIVSGLLFGIALVLPLGVLGAVSTLTLGAAVGGLAFVALTTLVSSESTYPQGATMSLNSSMFTLGSALGGFFGGILLAVGGFELMGIGLTAFMILAGTCVWHPATLTLPFFGRSATVD